jgi:hypothetical protein
MRHFTKLHGLNEQSRHLMLKQVVHKKVLCFKSIKLPCKFARTMVLGKLRSQTPNAVGLI